MRVPRQKQEGPRGLFDEEAATDIERISNVPPDGTRAPKKGPYASPSRIAAVTAQMIRMRDTGSWFGAGAAHLVAFYGWWHEEIYGVKAAELTGATFARACGMAKRLVETQFDGDYIQGVRFVNWTRQRERGREKWRREQGKKTEKRLAWGLQFNPVLVTDYRLAMAQRAKNPLR